MFHLIVAACEGMGIGMNGSLPWRLKEEMKYFAKMTKATQDPSRKNAVVMGRKTWESIPLKFRPLQGRYNVVLSRNSSLAIDSASVCSSLEDAVQHLKSVEGIETWWLIGGSSLYAEAMSKRLASKIYLTEIQAKFDCDTFFPAIEDEDYEELADEAVDPSVQSEGDIRYRFRILDRRVK